MNENPTLSVKEIQAIILEIMKDVDSFCRKNNIRYCISSGTLLGAVRHGGFIPWDDDADMFMLREDFDRFVKTYKSDKYHLLFNTDGDGEFFAMGYAKINDPITHMAPTSSAVSHGVFLDIFPLDAVPEEPKEQKKHMHRIMSAHNRLYHRHKRDIVSILKSYRHSLDWWIKNLDTIVHDPKYKDSPLVAHAVGSSNYRTVIARDRFDSLTDIRFEDHDFLAFADPHSYLSMVYGEDYMTPREWSHHLKVYREDEQD